MSKRGIVFKKHPAQSSPIKKSSEQHKKKNKQKTVSMTPLRIGIQYNKIDLIKSIANRESGQINLIDFAGYTPLGEAVRTGKIEIVKIILESKEIDLNKKDYYSDTALMIAVDRNMTDVIKVLLSDSRIDPNVKEQKHGCTPLLKAVILGHVEVVRMLLSCGKVDIYIEGAGLKGEPFMVAVSQNMVEIVEAFLESGRIDINRRYDSGMTALMNAVKARHCEITRKLIEAGADVGMTVKYLLYEGCNALMIAAYKGYADIIEIFLESKDININAHDEVGATALIIAAKENHVEAIKSLLKHPDIDPNIRGGLIEETALVHAVTGKNIDVVKVLLADPRVDPNEGGVLIVGKTPLMEAMCKNHNEIAEVLLANSRVDINARDKFVGYTALMHAVSSDNIVGTKTLLQRDDLDVNMQSLDGNTALMLSIAQNQLEKLNFLEIMDELETSEDKEAIKDITEHLKTRENTGKNQIAIIKELLLHPKIDLTLTNKKGKTAFDIASANTEEIKGLIVEKLSEQHRR